MAKSNSKRATKKSRPQVRSQAKKSRRKAGLKKKRKGGRPRTRSAGVSHDTRPSLKSRTPVHVTLSFVEGLPSMRSKQWALMITDIIGEMRGAWSDARIVEYTIQSNHMHMLCEAKSAGALATLMKSFKTRLTLRLNKHLGRKGTAYTERYHRSDLGTPTATRNALRYVLRNDVHHRSGAQRAKRAAALDGCSSTIWHKDFCDGDHPVSDAHLAPRLDPTSAAQSWRLTIGYSERGGGPLTITDLPKGAESPAV